MKAGMVMLFIDADNVSADVIDQAVDKVLREHGAIHVRRAYCTAETALKHLTLFKRHSIRPIVNLSSGKNSTDIALAVDAMDLVARECPQHAVLVSSDSDFAPLVIRLREKGCRVTGIGQEGKTGEGARGVYDEFVDLSHRKARAALAEPAAPARRRRTVATATPMPVAAPPPMPPKQPTPPSPATAAPVRRRARVAEPAVAPPPADVARLLDALPELRAGRVVELRHAAERLRAAGLLAKTAASTKLFRKYAELFVLTPEGQPNSVQYRASHLVGAL